jgi:uncharacterized protein YbjQ (UPF0145 family)
MLVTTANDLAGYRILEHLGVARGITVRSRSVVGNFLGGIHALFGGRITVYVTLAENARSEAMEQLIAHAQQGGANAIIAMRYESNEIMPGITEVLAYGTAVIVEKV